MQKPRSVLGGFHKLSLHLIGLQCSHLIFVVTMCAMHIETRTMTVDTGLPKCGGRHGIIVYDT